MSEHSGRDLAGEMIRPVLGDHHARWAVLTALQSLSR